VRRLMHERKSGETAKIYASAIDADWCRVGTMEINVSYPVSDLHMRGHKAFDIPWFRPHP